MSDAPGMLDAPQAACVPVEAFWELYASGGPHRVLPDGCMDVIFDLRTGRARVIGAMTRAKLVNLPQSGHYFGVRFRPAAITRFVKLSAKELVDADVPLGDVSSQAAELEDLVSSASSFAQRQLVCRDFMRSVNGQQGMADRRLLRAVATLQGTRGAARVGQVARSVALSERQLERLFAEHVGIRPKVFGRVMRLQAAIAHAAEAGAAARSQAAVAALAGYADEAHLIREFKALAGCSLRDVAPSGQDPRTMSDSFKSTPTPATTA